MAEPTVEVLSNLILEHSKSKDSISDTQIKTVPLDPSCTTYEMDGHWFKVMKAEPKNPNYTPLHREEYVLKTIDAFNRKTADLALHIPITKALFADASMEGVDRPYLLTEAITGSPLMKYMAQNNNIATPDILEAMGNDIGIFLARIHAISAKGCGLFAITGEGVHPGPWQKYFALVNESQWKHLKGSGVVDDSIIDKLAQMTIDNQSVMIGETVSLCHNDFQYSNMWIDPETKKLTGLVNYAQSGVGSPMADISSLYMHCSDENFWNKITESYQSIRSFPDKFEKKLAYYSYVFGLRAAWFFHMKKDEQTKGYYLRRAFEEASIFDDSFMAEAGKYASCTHPRVVGG